MRGIWEKLKKKYEFTIFTHAHASIMYTYIYILWNARVEREWILDFCHVLFAHRIRLISHLLSRTRLSFAFRSWWKRPTWVSRTCLLHFCLLPSYIFSLPCFAVFRAFLSYHLSSFRPEKYLFSERSVNDLINPWKAQSSVAVNLWAEQLRSRKENNYRYWAFCLSSLHPAFNVRASMHGETSHFLPSRFLE